MLHPPPPTGSPPLLSPFLPQLVAQLPALQSFRLEESLKQFAAPLREQVRSLATDAATLLLMMMMSGMVLLCCWPRPACWRNRKQLALVDPTNQPCAHDVPSMQVDLAREATHLHAFNYNFRSTGGQSSGPRSQGKGDRTAPPCDAGLPCFPCPNSTAPSQRNAMLRVQPACPSRCRCTRWSSRRCWWRRSRQAHTSLPMSHGEAMLGNGIRIHEGSGSMRPLWPRVARSHAPLQLPWQAACCL